MIAIELADVQVGVIEDPQGNRVIIASDTQSGIRIVLPLDRLAAATIARLLSPPIETNGQP